MQTHDNRFCMYKLPDVGGAFDQPFTVHVPSLVFVYCLLLDL